MVADNGKAPVPGRKVILEIQRQDGPDGPSRWESFEVEVEPGANVISCLQQIAANPVTRDGTKTTPVTWSATCLEEVCGACTMVINGRVRQSCSCLIDNYAPNDGDVITLEPMSKFPVIRDLYVDRSRLFNDLKRVSAWVPIDGSWDLGFGPKESPAQQQIRYALSQCMTCACCLEACPQYTKDNNFVGAAVIGQARLFNEHPTGAALKPARLEVLMGPGGVNDCGQAQNCVKVCPKDIPLTEAIAAIGRAATIHSIKKFFSGR
ncbi:MAG: succinate dehydrogenase iron-sulfur subunit [Phycisphaerales bacterium]